jgi:hypothetical protein
MNATATEYTVDYFIAKFKAIPEEKWCVEAYKDDSGRCCALGHCMAEDTPEVEASFESIYGLFTRIFAGPTTVNDGRDPRYPQPTPKQRILAALRDIKAKQEAAR